MQPLTSSQSSQRRRVVKLKVPESLQPDGAKKRPANTGPSLVEAPVGIQPPYCARPPRWVQKQERGQGNTEHRSQKSSTGQGGWVGVGADKLLHHSEPSTIAITTAIQSEAIPARKTDRLTTEDREFNSVELQGGRDKQNRERWNPYFNFALSHAWPSEVHKQSHTTSV